MIKLFLEKSINDYFTVIFTKVKSDLQSMTEDKFMDYDPKELADNKLESTKLDHFEIDLTKRTSNVEILNLLADKFPKGYDVVRGERYPCARVSYTYELPKNSELLSFSPTDTPLNKIIPAEIKKEKLVLYYQTFYGNENLSEDVKRTVKNWIADVHEDIENVVQAINKDIDHFNNTVGDAITKIITERRLKIEAKRNQNDDLNNF